MNPKKKRRISLKNASIFKISISSLIMLLSVWIAVSLVIYNYIFDTLSSSRVMSLQQSGYSLNTIRNAVRGIADITLSALGDIIYVSQDEKNLSAKLTSPEILENIFETQISLMNNLGFEMSIDVVTADGNSYTSNPLYEPSLKSFISSQWFINMVYGSDKEQDDRTWGIRTIDPAELNLMVLSYSQSIRNIDGSVLGVLIVNVNHSVLYETYSQLLNSYSDNSVSVIDDDGIIISHQNENLIGFHMYNKTYMASQMPHNSSTLEKNGRNYFLTTTYFEPESGWVIIEKLPVCSLLKPLQSLFIALLIILTGALIMSCLIGLGLSTNITKRLSALTAYMTDFQTEQSARERFPLLESDYEEIYTLGNGFNKMMENISELIENIRTSELERQKIEFNFLQAQINPHFLHNTLLSVKSLIMLKREDDAMEMLQAFLGLIRTPINAQNPLVPMEDEIISIKNYIRIMEFRYITKFNLTVNLPADILALKIPQMTLQPIIENCIFHGFSNISHEKKIQIFCVEKEGIAAISIRDNGKGMSSLQLEQIWKSDTDRHHSFNHISMGNILKRLQWIYGKKANILVESTLNSGTTVTLYIPVNYLSDS